MRIEGLPSSVVDQIRNFQQAQRDYATSCYAEGQPSYAVIEIPKTYIADALLESLGLPTGTNEALDEEESRRGAGLRNPKQLRRSDITTELRWKIFKRDGYKCVNCHADVDLTVDHVHPYSKGGTAHEGNLSTLCRSCNARKGNR